MRVNRTSTLTGNNHTMEIPYTEDNFIKYLEGTPLLQAFPGITDEQKLFILEGITKEELLAKQEQDLQASLAVIEESAESSTESAVEPVEDSFSKKKKSVNYK